MALLTPLPEVGPAEQMRRSGRLKPGEGDLRELMRELVCRASPRRGSLSRARCSRRCGPMSGEPRSYLDSSALVKLVLAEAESAVLDGHLGPGPP